MIEDLFKPADKGWISLRKLSFAEEIEKREVRFVAVKRENMIAMRKQNTTDYFPD